MFQYFWGEKSLNFLFNSNFVVMGFIGENITESLTYSGSVERYI